MFVMLKLLIIASICCAYEPRRWHEYISSVLKAAIPHTPPDIVTLNKHVTSKALQMTSHCIVKFEADPPDFLPMSPCGAASPKIPPEDEKTWTMAIHAPFILNVTISQFNLTASISKCRIESLSLLGSRGFDKSNRMFSTWTTCGTRLPWNTFTLGNYAKAVYKTIGGERSGKFVITYQTCPTDSQHIRITTIFNEENAPKGQRLYGFQGGYYFSTIFESHLIKFLSPTRPHSPSLTIIRAPPTHYMSLHSKLLRKDRANCTGLYTFICHDGPTTRHPVLPDIPLEENWKKKKYLHDEAKWLRSFSINAPAGSFSSAFAVACEIMHNFAHANAGKCAALIRVWQHFVKLPVCAS